MEKSNLQSNPISKVIESGYINIYSELNPKEKRLISFKRNYKSNNPLWDDTQVYLSDYFKANVVNNAVVLDAGCGNGNYVIDENRNKISWAAGIDISQDLVGKNVCLDEIKLGNLENIPFEENTFDAVISLWVLEHLQNPELVVNEIHRVLKPGGIFMFATPNKNYFPLRMMSLISNNSINGLLNKKLYGRNEKDVFMTFYRSNDILEIKQIMEGKFKTDVLRYNYDPSYLAFNGFFFNLFNGIHSIISSTGINITYPHIVGIFKKI